MTGAAAGAWRPQWAWQPRWIWGQPGRRPRPLSARVGPHQPVPAWITQLVGFPDGRTGRPRLLVTSYAGARAVLDLIDGQLVGAMDERAHANVCAIARIDGECMIVSGAGAGYLQVSDLETGRSRWRRRCGDVRSLATVTLVDRPFAVLAGGSSQLQLWSLAVDRGEPVATLRIGVDRIAVLAAVEFGAGALVAAGTSAGRVSRWRLTAAPHGGRDVRMDPLGEHEFEVPGLVGALEFADWQGRPTLLGSAGSQVRAWDATSGQPLGPAFTGHAGQVNSVAAGRLGDRSVLWSSDDSTVRAWLPETGEQLGEPFHYPYEAELMRTAAVEFPDRPMLVTGDGAGVVWAWDPERPYPFRRGAGADPSGGGPAPVVVTELAGRPVVIAVRTDRPARAFDLVDGTEVELWLDGIGGHPGVDGIGGHPRVDGIGGHCRVDGIGGRPLDGMAGQPRREGVGGEMGPGGSAAGLLVAPGDPPLLARLGGGRIELWDPATGHRLGPGVAWLDGEPGALASGLVDGRQTLLLAARSELFCFDVATGRRTGTLAGHTGRIHAVTVTHSRGVPIALTAAQDGTVRLWDVRSGRESRTVLDGHGGGAYAITTATVDGRRLAFSAGQNGQVRGIDLTGLPEGPGRADGPEPWLVLHAGGSVRALAVVAASGIAWLVAADRATLLCRPIGESNSPGLTPPGQVVQLSGVVTGLVAAGDTLVVAAEDGLLGYRPPVPR